MRSQQFEFNSGIELNYAFKKKASAVGYLRGSDILHKSCSEWPRLPCGHCGASAYKATIAHLRGVRSLGNALKFEVGQHSSVIFSSGVLNVTLT